MLSGHDSATESVQALLEGFGVGAIYMEPFLLASQQKMDLQIVRTPVGDAGCEITQQLDVVLVVLLDFVLVGRRWC